MRGTRFAMVTTIGEGDALRSRPLTMQNHRHDIGDKLFFFVPAAGEVADDLRHDPRVGVVLRMAKAAVVRRPPTDIGEHRDVPVR